MSPELVQAIKDLGALGFAILAVYGFLAGRVRVGSLVDQELARRDQREKELKDERDAALALAAAATPELKRLNDLLDTAIRHLLDPNRRPVS